VGVELVVGLGLWKVAKVERDLCHAKVGDGC
jgi:hypothetical protein